MIERLGANGLLYALLLVLPISALIWRRVPFVRMVMMLGTWAALFALLLFVVAQRERFDPYLGRISGVLHPNDQQVVGKEVGIRMSQDGHFWAR